MHFNQAKQGCNEVDNNKDIKEVERQENKIGVIPEICNRECKTLFDNRTSPSASRTRLSGDDSLFFMNGNDSRVEDPGQKPSGMTLCDSGFTLIELLIVVLIIGILAAVALPQYQKAVQKSKAMQGLAILKPITDSISIYYLANGECPSSFSDLDISLPSDFTGTDVGYKTSAVDSRSNGQWSITLEKYIPNNVCGVHIGQLIGDYRGAGFSYFETIHPGYNAHQLYCNEFVYNTDYPFEKEEGSFCSKIFQGRKISTTRTYEI